MKSELCSIDLYYWQLLVSDNKGLYKDAIFSEIKVVQLAKVKKVKGKVVPVLN